ncbi:MAG: MoxR family ATPase [Verrucomicrobia bacterium]|nr:AAA family ATPase [Verrucomicrobiota bacterium]MDA0723220.1 MoxR family ATPase [Verrucomicrobiota bacterium]MDA1045765.1 MoxR family ATPase [Verrucomicrobiota bacterium]
MTDQKKDSDKPAASDNDVKAIERLRDANKRIVAELGKVIIGQTDVIDELMIAIFARGHCLLVGVPGLAKTLLVSTLSRALSLSFNRIQFTPDLMPSDITGTEILADDPESGERKFKFLRGPVFANIVLADEINRTPPKTQAALLEAMQEKKVSAGGESFTLEEPFFVLATQNPLEQEGTYPLPEAQLDRFLFNIIVDYPNRTEEIDMMKRISGDFESNLDTVMDRDEIIALQDTVRRIPVADHIFEYASTLVRATRPDDEEAPEFIREWLSYGAGPRASLYLITAGKARAALRGRLHMAIEDVQALAPAILRHRIILNFAARSEGMTSDDVIRKLLDTIPADENLYEAQAR